MAEELGLKAIDDKPDGHDAPWSPRHHPDAIAVSQTDWWYRAVSLCARRLREGRGREQQLDSRFFVIALAQLRKETEIGLRFGDPEIRSLLLEAMAQFDRDLPGVTDARNIIMHFDEYISGTGWAQRREAAKDAPEEVRDELARRDATGIHYDPKDNAVRVGVERYRFPLNNALEVSAALRNAVYDALSRH